MDNFPLKNNKHDDGNWSQRSGQHLSLRNMHGMHTFGNGMLLEPHGRVCCQGVNFFELNNYYTHPPLLWVGLELLLWTSCFNGNSTCRPFSLTLGVHRCHSRVGMHTWCSLAPLVGTYYHWFLFVSIGPVLWPCCPPDPTLQEEPIRNYVLCKHLGWDFWLRLSDNKDSWCVYGDASNMLLIKCFFYVADM